MMMRSTGGNSTHRRPDGMRGLAIAAAALMSMALIFAMIYQARAAEPANSHFQSTWQRTDDPVESGLVSRTWMWGPEGFTGQMTEAYVESPSGERIVQYFDKSRMEITDPAAPTNSVWYVTNGLLVVELVTGQMQMGDNSFTQYNPATANVAGDQGVANGPTYATMAGLLDDPALSDGLTITQRVDASGSVTNDPSLASFGVTAAYHVTEPGIDHQVASPFWSFMNSSGTVYENGSYINAPMFLSPFYATGYPITEAYWANVSVGGVQQDVLLQCFERRCLTYTPGNSSGWQVEAGNVGQHYYEWRYQQVGEEPTATGTAEPSPTEPPVTGTPPASPTPTVPPTTTPTVTPEPALDYQYLTKFGRLWDPTKTISLPRGIAAGDGYVYIAEFGDDRVQKFTVDGIYVDSWEGFGSPFDVAIGPDGNVWVVDANENLVKKYSPDGTFLTQIGDPTLSGCIDGVFSAPSGVAFSSTGDIYVVDRLHNRVQQFTAAGVFIDAYGNANCTPGNGNTEFDLPDAIAFDANDNFYVTDNQNERVVKFNAAGTYITQWGSPGGFPSSLDGEFDNPFGIVVSPGGIIYVVDAGNARVQGFDLDGGYLGKFGEFGTDPGYFGEPLSIDIDESGYIYVADHDNSNYQKFDSGRNFVERITDNRKGHFGDAMKGMTRDADGNVYVTDNTFDRVLKYDRLGQYLFELGVSGTGPGQLDDPAAVAASADGYLYVLDAGRDYVLKFTQDGEFLYEWGGSGTGNGQFTGPLGIEVDASGNVYVADSGYDRIQKFTSDGNHIPWVDPNAMTFDRPVDIAIHGDTMYVVENGNHRIQSFSLDGVPLDEWGSYGTTIDGQFNGPFGIGVDSYGFVYVADSGNDRIQKFTPDGSHLATFSESGTVNGALDNPVRIEITDNGYVYVLDKLNDRVQVFEPVS